MRPSQDGSSSSSYSSSSHGVQQQKKRLKGIRRRKWGKWVSEIRVPGTRDRLWLGSYSNPEAAAIAYDTAMFCLRGPSSVTHLNFPECLPHFLETNLSPKSIQIAASNAAMAIDYELAKMAALEGVIKNDNTVNEGAMQVLETQIFEDRRTSEECWYQREGESLDISVDDIEIYLG